MTQKSNPASQNQDNAHLKARISMSVYLVYTLTLISLYNLTIEIVQRYEHQLETSTYITIIVLLVFAGALFIMIKQMHLPLVNFGFSLKNLKPAMRESLLWTFLFCFFLLLGKLMFIHLTQRFSGFPVFDLPETTQKIHYFYMSDQNTFETWFLSGILYIIFAPIQTFIIQGAIQSPLIHLLRLRNSVWVAVLLSTFIFAAIHVDLSYVHAYAVLLPGLLWAILYTRHRSLLPVAVSHAIIGIWAFWFLG